MRKSFADRGGQGKPRWTVLVALGVAVLAMSALHVFQPELDPVAEPVSFYVWGARGWLLPVALGAFGLAWVGLARAPAASRPARSRQIVATVGAVLLLAAIAPSDRWFPWEQRPTLSGLVHATAAMLAPALLLWPMVTWTRARDLRLRRVLACVAVAYGAALMASAGSLLLGLSRGGPPPGIGALERVLASAAVIWVSVIAWQAGRSDD
jgi:hypothetical protein